MAKLYEVFGDAINQVIDNTAVNQDQTINADIVEILNIDSGLYRVSYEGNTFPAYSQSADTTYNINDSVYVLVPFGDFSKKKIILSLASETSSYNDSLAEVNYYTDAGPNLLNFYGNDELWDIEGHICACPENNKNLLTGVAQYSHCWWNRKEEEVQADAQVQWYSTKHEYLKIQADFKTNFTALHSQGQYYLRLTALINNPDYKAPTDPDYNALSPEPMYNTVTYDLGFSSFTGSPYQYTNWLTQTAYFAVPKGTIQGLSKLELLQDGNFEADYSTVNKVENGILIQDKIKIYNINNISCKNIRINYAEQVNLNDGLYHCWISTPLGNTLYKNEDGGGQSYVKLVPHLYYKNVDYIEDCEVRWFRRNSSILAQTPNSDNRDQYNRVWTDYTGPGWEPIDNVLNNGFGEEWNRIDDNDNQTLLVYLDGVKWSWDYKCVCIYTPKNVANGDNWFTAEATVTNRSYDCYYDLFMDEETNTNRYLFINDNKHNVRQYNLLADPSGNTLYRHWFGKWFVYLSDGSYTPIKFNGQYMIEGPLDVTDWLKNDIVTFRVQCFDPYQYDPEGDGVDYVQCAPIGELEYTIVNSDKNAVGYWEGDKSFNYDANGKAKNSLNYNDHHVKLVLKFPGTDNYANGSYYSIDFYAPDGERLLTADSYTTFETDGQAYDPANSMLRCMYIDDTNSVHFKVKQEYDIENSNEDNNTIYAIIKYYNTGSIYKTTCPIAFTKDGEQGTQGSDWVAPIYPCNIQPYVRRSSNDDTEYELLLNIKAATGTNWALVAKILSETTFSGENGNRLPEWSSWASMLIGTYGLTETEVIAIKPYWEWKTEQWQIGTNNNNDLISSFLQKDELPNPLILIKDGEHWIQKANNHVCFRPFISKNGVAIEDMNPYDGYFYKIWWDVRYDGSHKKLPFGSPLRLYHAREGGQGNIYEYICNTSTSALTEWGGANVTKGSSYEFANNGKGNYESEANGLVGFNCYPSKGLVDEYSTMVENYGAVEVRYVNNYDHKDGTGATIKNEQDNNENAKIENLNYIFFVKARIEIFKGGYDYNLGCINPNSTSAELVSTITSWYPVDVFLNPSNIEFNRSKYITNYPRFVIYNSYGQNPVMDVADSTNGSSKGAKLLSVYGDRSYTIGDYELYSPVIKNMTPILKTPDLAELGTTLTTYKETNLGVETETEKTVNTYVYKPKDSLTWQHGLISSLITEAGTALDDDGNDLWRGGQYIRCQIMTLNQYGNTNINGWDGESITTEDGCIFSPTVGAGYKDKASNQFTGVIMGIDSQWKKEDLSTYVQNIHGYDTADKMAHPYLAGLYGYQRGKSTFGLMENGTAFFGRADRGGRIYIDGYHATMYGGANGLQNKPCYNDSMWNTMRLSFVDLYHLTDSEDTGGVTLGFNGEFYGDDDFPDWLKQSWRRAYVVGKNQAPYWLMKKEVDDGNGRKIKKPYEYSDLLHSDGTVVWYGGQEKLNSTNGENKGYGITRTLKLADSNTVATAPLSVPYNAPINYWDNEGTNQGGEHIKFSTTDEGVLSFEDWLYAYPEYNESSGTKIKYNSTNTLRYLCNYKLGTILIHRDRTKRNIVSTKEYLEDIEIKQMVDNSILFWDSVVLTEYENWYRRLWCYLHPDANESEIIYPTIVETEDKEEQYKNACKALTDEIGFKYHDFTNKSIVESDIKAYINYLINKFNLSSYYNTISDATQKLQVEVKELFGVNSWAELVRSVIGEIDVYNKENVLYQYETDPIISFMNDNFTKPYQKSVFGPSRASTTPAIEIGQHVHGLRPGRIELAEYENVMKHLDVPGDRNFMVTYDGTMWAMNGVFMGNVVGSNIVGGRIIGGELLIGEIETNAFYWEVDSTSHNNPCDWTTLTAPTQTKKLVSDSTSAAIALNSDGSIQASKLYIYGGSIDIGGFHILGKDKDTSLSENKGEGHLVQFGESDFIGPTHCYGNLGIGPNLGPGTNKNEGSNWGNLFQTYGQVGLGVQLPNKSNLTFHKLVATSDGKMGNTSAIQYDYNGSLATSKPQILDATGAQACLECYSVFGINTTSDTSDYAGHFWPMSFRTSKGGNSTTESYSSDDTDDDYDESEETETTVTDAELQNKGLCFKVTDVITKEQATKLGSGWCDVESEGWYYYVNGTKLTFHNVQFIAKIGSQYFAFEKDGLMDDTYSAVPRPQGDDTIDSTIKQLGEDNMVSFISALSSAGGIKNQKYVASASGTNYSKFTTMDVFATQNSNMIKDGSKGVSYSNFFRIDHVGVTANTLYIYNGFVGEKKELVLDRNKKACVGFVGMRSLDWDKCWDFGKTGSALGLSSWSGHSLVFKSDAALCSNARTCQKFYGAAFDGAAQDTTRNWLDNTTSFGVQFSLGGHGQYGTNYNSLGADIYLSAGHPKSVVCIGVRDDGEQIADNLHPFSSVVNTNAGLLLDSYAKGRLTYQGVADGDANTYGGTTRCRGTILYCKPSEVDADGVHILLMNKNKSEKYTHSELTLMNTHATLYHEQRITLQVGSQKYAHLLDTETTLATPMLDFSCTSDTDFTCKIGTSEKYIQQTQEQIIFQGYEPKQQQGIYARFA